VIASEMELEDRLSDPSAGDIAAMREIEGDIVVLGVSGKMGPSLARLAARAASGTKRVIGVARHVDESLREHGIETLRADLLDAAQVAALPDAPNVIFMAGRKFGSTGAEGLTWAMNTYVPALVAERYRRSRIVVFSSGNVYPLVPVVSGGARENTRVAPVGEYAQSVLGRERIFEHFSAAYGTPVCILRLNYAIDLRYGVLLDIALRVHGQRPINLAMGSVNVIWQGDANSVALRSLAVCGSPPLVLNLTGPETLSVRAVACRFGELLEVEPIFEGQESSTALLNNASACFGQFGYPRVTVEQMIQWTAEWVKNGGSRYEKPTHFQTRDGNF